jgi:hypothetical protein
MRLRHVIMLDQRTFRDFGNASLDYMVLACRDRTKEPSATHEEKGGWFYRLDVRQLSGVGVVHVRGVHLKYGRKELYVPIGSFKELIPWRADDDKADRFAAAEHALEDIELEAATAPKAPEAARA